jgi:hypothetical protein
LKAGERAGRLGCPQALLRQPVEAHPPTASASAKRRIVASNVSMALRT